MRWRGDHRNAKQFARVLQGELFGTERKIKEIAEEAGLSPSTLYQIRGRSDVVGYRPQLRTVSRLAAALGYEIVMRVKNHE